MWFRTLKAYILGVGILLVMSAAGRPLAAQDSPSGGEECCVACHCPPPPTEPGICGDWPGEVVCKTVKETWCWKLHPGGIGVDACIEVTTYYYYS